MKYLKKEVKEVEKKHEVDQYKRDSIYAELKQFCIFSIAKDNHDYIEVTEWANGEGFDIDIETSQRQRFQLSWGQWEALKHLINIIENK
jgi:hypothetical protein